MDCSFLPPSQKLDILCSASYCTLCLPSNWDTNFQVANKEEATQDVMDVRVLRYHLQTIGTGPKLELTSSDWWEGIILDTWNDKQWVRGFCMCQATFMDIFAQLAPHIMYQEKQVAIAIMKLATPSNLDYAIWSGQVYGWRGHLGVHFVDLVLGLLLTPDSKRIPHLPVAPAA
ncbi:hypothetical protein Y1Q_0003084 [Alligator mississippiensis]|uniref:Uncharacterized protein n=1 Tax=Alligator mississippiensis TaxID=8496 RepID=A0A151MDG1_ALLMI|nr:hypothetical protein Y1Q_0003084 [Alligator mississippiensis]